MYNITYDFGKVEGNFETTGEAIDYINNNIEKFEDLDDIEIIKDGNLESVYGHFRKENGAAVEVFGR